MCLQLSVHQILRLVIKTDECSDHCQEDFWLTEARLYLEKVKQNKFSNSSLKMATSEGNFFFLLFLPTLHRSGRRLFTGPRTFISFLVWDCRLKPDLQKRCYSTAGGEYYRVCVPTAPFVGQQVYVNFHDAWIVEITQQNTFPMWA